MSKRRGAPEEIFLSHSSADRAFASRVADVLRSSGLPVWYSRTNVVGAQQWHDEIGAALARCTWFVLLLSPSSVKSPWVERELLYALQEPRYEDRIVPVMLRKCDISKLSRTLPAFQFVDFTAKHESGFAELLRIWGRGYDPRRRRP